MIRYLVFVTPPNNLYTSQEEAESQAVEMAKGSLGSEVQVWRLTGEKLSTVTASIQAEVTEV
jgi:hypothetical protein